MCEAFDVTDGPWMSQLVDHYTSQLVSFAEEADYEILSNPFQAKQAGIDLSNMSENQKLENALQPMVDLYGKLNQASKRQLPGMEGESNENSKLGANLLALQIIKVQFALNKFDLCDRFFKDLYSEEEMPKSWRVNVSYYKGRFHMYSNDFVQAQRHLKNALELCHDQGLVNQKKILKYLIPVEMNKGNYPSPDLLRKYDLEQEYLDIVRSVTDGNLAALEKAMNKNQDSFIQSGVFITMERLRMVTLRNFVKRVAAAVQAEPRLQYKEKKTQI